MKHFGLRLRRLSGWVLLMAVLSSCSIAVDDLAVTRVGGSTSPLQAAVEADGLPVLGPVPASSHWHAAYVVRLCNDVLDPFESDADPLGIHSHGDGLMHIHPFVEEAGYENATLGLFADAMGFSIGEGELTLPGGGTWRDGDLCDGVPGRVFVDRWQGPSPDSAIERVFTDLENIRFLADAELYQIAFAPVDSPPVVPPAFAALPEVSNLDPPPDPWVDVPAQGTLEDVQVWQVAAVGVEECGEPGAVLERVLSGEARCFVPADDPIAGSAAIVGAQAVRLSRQPAIDVRIGQPLQSLIAEHFREPDPGPLGIAIEIDGAVVTAPLIVRRPATPDRLVVSGGLSAESALALAAILDGA